MKLIEYLKDTKGEMKHVSWPTRRQAFFYTMLVVLCAIVTAFFLGVFDSIFSFGLEKLIL
jgi:preprotein translocase subunit SecE